MNQPKDKPLNHSRLSGSTAQAPTQDLDAGPRFQARKYREDFAGLTHKIIDTQHPDLLVDEALTAEDAADLADAMNSLNDYYHGGNV